MADIIYTTVDEAPELASASLLPIIRKFVSAAGLQIEKRDISLAGRIIAMFPEILTDAQRHGDDLAALGDLVKTPQANVIKLPNISASVPQLKAAISELQAQGYALLCVCHAKSDLTVEIQDEDEVYELQFGRHFGRGRVRFGLPLEDD